MTEEVTASGSFAKILTKSRLFPITVQSCFVGQRNVGCVSETFTMTCGIVLYVARTIFFVGCADQNEASVRLNPF